MVSGGADDRYEAIRRQFGVNVKKVLILVLTLVTTLAAILAAVLVTAASPASAAAAPSAGWVPAPTPPFDIPAGAVCDFPIHGEPVVDKVVSRVLATYPDGSTKVQLAKGPLILRITNVDNGKAHNENGSGTGLFRFATDGSFTVDVVGPLLIGFRAGLSNVPRGFYELTGAYRIAFGTDGFRTLTMFHGTMRNVCGDFL